MLDQDFVKTVKNASNLIEVIGEHVLLRKTGANWVGLCPFHQERSPSFSANETKQLFHCYGCKKGGDLIKFVQELHGLSFREAIEDLAERARIPLPKNWSGSGPEEAKDVQAKREHQALLHKLTRFTAKFYHDHLARDSDAIAYLRRRGVTPELQELFYLGATPQGWSPLSKRLIDAKAPVAEAEQLGLIRASQKGTPGGIPYFDLFRSRVLFPILDLRGKVVGFGGRIFGKDAGDGPKYLNSSESPLFQKSRVLYGLYQGQKTIRERNEVIVVEGYFDHLSLYKAGFENTVATCGTALTLEHLKLLHRFAEKIILLFDGDTAGESATLRAMELGLQHGMTLHAAVLPHKRDVDEILLTSEGQLSREGVEQVKSIFAASEPVVDREIRLQLEKTRGSAEEKTQAVKRLIEIIGHFTDPVALEVRESAICSALNITVATFRGWRSAQGSKSGSSGRVITNSNPSTVVVSPNTPSAPRREGSTSPRIRIGGGAPAERPSARTGLGPLDRNLLNGILLGGQYLQMTREAQGFLPRGFELPDLAQNPDIRLILRQVEAGGAPSAEWESIVQEEEVKQVLRAALLLEGGSAVVTGSLGNLDLDDFRVVVRKALQRTWARFSQKLREDLVQKGELHLSQEWLDVQNKIKELGNFYDQIE